MPENKRIAVWVDHAKAHIVEIQGEEISEKTIESNVERQQHATGGTRIPGKNFMKTGGSSEQHTKAVRNEHLHRYYKDLVVAVDGAFQLVILGPAEAKKEFATFVEKSPKLAARLTGVETAEAMTDRQLVAWAKKYFSTHRAP